MRDFCSYEVNKPVNHFRKNNEDTERKTIKTTGKFLPSVLLSTAKKIEIYHVQYFPLSRGLRNRYMRKMRNLPRLELPLAILIVLSKDSLDTF